MRGTGLKMEKKLKYNLAENMLISFLITFAAGASCYEESIPVSFIGLFRTVMIIMSIGTWFYISFFSGASSKWQFVIFTAIFWLAPQLIIYLADNGPEVCRMSTTMYLLSEFFSIMFNTPAEYMGGFFRIEAFPFIVIIALMCTFVFLAGTLFSMPREKR